MSEGSGEPGRTPGHRSWAWLVGGVLASTVVGFTVLVVMLVRPPELPPLVDRDRRLLEPPRSLPWDEPAPPPAPAAGMVRFDVPPRIVKRFSPQYPEAAIRAGIEGRVEVLALVGEDGRVKQTRIASSDPVFDRSALHAVRQYTFEPARADGKPVAAWTIVPIRYQLTD